MGKTNDKNEFPMEVGTLSVACKTGRCELEIYEPEEGDKPYVYDQKTGNFHLLPADEEVFQHISKEITEKRNAILAELKLLLENQQDKEIVLKSSHKRVGGNIVPLAPNDKYRGGHLFANIEVKKGDKQYFLFFIRFYTDEQKAVHCILKEYQFRCENMKAYCAYPATCELGVTETVCRTFYNPEIPFECESSMIAKCFLDFVMNN